MLGLADRTRTIDLFEAVMRGDAAGALKELRAQYDIGADPAVALSDLAEFTHFVTRVKVVPAVADDVSFAEVRAHARPRLRREALDARAGARLADAAQGHHRGRGVAAARWRRPRWCWCGIAYAADLPTPDEVIRSLDGNGSAPAPRAGRQWRRRRRPRRPAVGGAAVRRRRAATRRAARRGAALRDRAADGRPPWRRRRKRRRRRWRSARFEELIALAAQKRDLGGQGRARTRRAAGALRGRPARRRARAERRQDAGQRPLAASSRNGPAGAGWSWCRAKTAQPTVKSSSTREQAELKTGVQADPLVQAVLARFPGAEIVDVRAPDQMPALPSRRPGRADTLPEPPPADDGFLWCGLDPRRRSGRLVEECDGRFPGPDEAGRRAEIQDGGDAGRARSERGRGRRRRRARRR